jgi:hypothetical protein
MADESILTYKKPGFPKETLAGNGYSTTIEYIGPTSTLEAALPAIGATWGEYTGYVQTREMEPVEGNAGYSELKVVVSYEFSGTDSTFGTARETTFEIEWLAQSRSLVEHPKFQTGGTYALDNQDLIDLGFWQDEPDATLKAAFKYNELAATGSGDIAELTSAAKMCAAGILLGYEYWDDFVPVLRKNTTYLGGPPNASEAGDKASGAPAGFPTVPTGYEWRKSADRSIRAGGQNRWERAEEWVGEKKVQIDKSNVYWSAP